MTSLKAIKTYPTTLESKTIRAQLDALAAPAGYHESLFRCYHILEKVKEYLADDVPPKVILELIEVMEEE